MNNNLSITVNAKRYDPTRTTGLRNRFVADCNRRFQELSNVVWKSIVDEDCFGLKESQMMNVLQLKSTGSRTFSFIRSTDKVKGFMDWLRAQQASGILEIRNVNQWGSAIEESWTNLYVYDSYKRGVIRSRYELKKAGYDVPSMEGFENVYATLNNPLHVDRLGLLYSRVYSDLKGITEGMDTLISRVLTQGLADGDNPIPLARKLRAVITGQGMGDLGITDSLGRFIPAKRRAEMLARTEIIRAHAEASLQEFENWAVEGVEVEIEWAASGDACSLCLEMASNGPYTIQQARGLIPYHPNCRCAWLPKRKK
jgi:hypothetical protein